MFNYIKSCTCIRNFKRIL